MQEFPHAPKQTSPRVLIVDDDADHAEILAGLLRRRGYGIAVALSGERAVALARLLRPDLILLDLYMPEVDGFSTAAHLHGDPETRDVPIVFLSACGEPATVTRAIEAGALEYLAKPFHAAELIACVERSLLSAGHRRPCH
jgi:putative two-component system response regulator